MLPIYSKKNIGVERSVNKFMLFSKILQTDAFEGLQMFTRLDCACVSAQLRQPTFFWLDQSENG